MRAKNTRFISNWCGMSRPSDIHCRMACSYCSEAESESVQSLVTDSRRPNIRRCVPKVAVQVVLKNLKASDRKKADRPAARYQEPERKKADRLHATKSPPSGPLGPKPQAAKSRQLGPPTKSRTKSVCLRTSATQCVLAHTHTVTHCGTHCHGSGTLLKSL